MPLPVLRVSEELDPRSFAAGRASQVWGSQVNLALNLQSSLVGSFYFSKSLPLYEALRQGRGLAFADDSPGLLALRGQGAEHVLTSGSAVQQKLNYATGKFQLQGSYVNVDSAFTVPGASVSRATGDRSGADALAAMRGIKELQFQAKYQPLSALSLTASQRRWGNEQPGHAQIGMTINESAQSLVYQLGGSRQLKADYQTRNEEWRGHGPMSMRKLVAHLDATTRLALDYSYDFTDNQRDGQNEKGLTRSLTKESLVYQLSNQTRLNLNFNHSREEWNRGDHVDVTSKSVSEYALHQAFGSSTKADVVRTLTSTTTTGARVDVTATSLHLERKPKRGLGLIGDWLDSRSSDGTGHNQLSLALDGTLGSGRGRTKITGLYKQLSQGGANRQVDTDYQLAITAAPSRLLQLNANYESFNQHGPSAEHQFVRTNLGLVSQLSKSAKLTADFARETDKGALTKANTGARIEFNPGWLTLTGGVTMQDGQAQPRVRTTFADLKIKFGRPLAAWAKALSGADALPGANAYGLRGAPTWAALGDGTLTVNYIGRGGDGQATDTRSVGYQTMLGRRFYVKLAMHENPMVPKDNTTVMTPARWNSYEGGVDLSHGFAGVARFIREQDLKSGGGLEAQVYALRGVVGGRQMLTFLGGVQKVQLISGAATDWQFANLNLKLGRPLADWAKSASNTGLFDDDVKYGYRQLPAWATFADGGLSLQYLSRSPQNGANLTAAAAGYQTMLGRNTYLKFAFQQNPLDGNAKVVEVNRTLYEIGRRVGAKFVALGRYVSDDSLNGGKSVSTSLLGLRGRLSARERLESVIVVDNSSGVGGTGTSTTYGLQYAREAGEGHYLIIKSTYSHGGQQAGQNGPDSYQIDFAYKKDM